MDLSLCFSILASYNGSEEGGNNNATSSEVYLCPHNMSVDLSGQTSAERPPLLETHFFTAIAYIGLTCAIMGLGTFGNIIILIIKLNDKKMNKFGTIFTVNSAISDLCISAVAEPVCVIGAIKGEKWFSQYWFACEAVALLCFTACVCSFLSFILLTVNRYIFTCHNKSYYDIFTTRRCVVACILTWTVSFMFDSANLLGWSDHYFDRKSQRCMWSRLESKSFTMLTPIVLLGLFPPLSFLFFLSFRKIFKTKQRLHGYDDKDTKRRYRAFTKAVQSSKILFVTFIIMVICWLPAGLLYGIDFVDKVGMQVYLFLTLLAHVHACANIIIFIFMNPTFRVSLLDLFMGRLGEKKKKRLNIPRHGPELMHKKLTTTQNVYKTNKCPNGIKLAKT